MDRNVNGFSIFSSFFFKNFVESDSQFGFLLKHLCLAVLSYFTTLSYFEQKHIFCPFLFVFTSIKSLSIE